VLHTSSLYGAAQDGPYLSARAQARQGETMPTRVDRAEVPFYPDDLLPQLQRTLAILADLDLRHEFQRDQLESWSGPRKVKDHLLAELEQCHTANRERLVSCLEGLGLKARGLEPATPRRRDH